MKELLATVKDKLDLMKKDNNLNKSVIDPLTIKNAKREYLKQILYGRLNFDESFYEKIQYFNINLSQEKNCVLMFKVDSTNNEKEKQGIRPILEEVLLDYSNAYICYTGFNELSIIYNFNSDDNSDPLIIVKDICERIINIMQDFFNQNIVIYVSEIFDLLDKIPLAYFQVCQTHSLKSFGSESLILFYSEVMKSRNFRDYRSFEDFIHKFDKSFKNEDVNSIIKIFNDLEIFIDRSKYIELSQIKYLTSSVIYISNYYLEKYSFSKNVLWDSVEQQYELLHSMQKKSDFIYFLNNFKSKISSMIIKEDYNHIIRNVKNYIRQYYRDNIVLKDLAEEFGVTNNYLSSLFKKETGETLKDYIIGKKINKSKQLLRETNDHISQISNYVGYDNEHYFCRIFKQKVGMTPSQYRNETPCVNIDVA